MSHSKQVKKLVKRFNQTIRAIQEGLDNERYDNVESKCDLLDKIVDEIISIEPEFDVSDFRQQIRKVSVAAYDKYKIYRNINRGFEKAKQCSKQSNQNLISGETTMTNSTSNNQNVNTQSTQSNKGENKMYTIKLTAEQLEKLNTLRRQAFVLEASVMEFHKPYADVAPQLDAILVEATKLVGEDKWEQCEEIKMFVESVKDKAVIMNNTDLARQIDQSAEAAAEAFAHAGKAYEELNKEAKAEKAKKAEAKAKEALENKGLSTTTKVVLGLGAAAAVGYGIYRWFK